MEKFFHIHPDKRLKLTPIEEKIEESTTIRKWMSKEDIVGVEFVLKPTPDEKLENFLEENNKSHLLENILKDAPISYLGSPKGICPIQLRIITAPNKEDIIPLIMGIIKKPTQPIKNLNISQSKDEYIFALEIGLVNLEPIEYQLKIPIKLSPTELYEKIARGNIYNIRAFINPQLTINS